MLDVETTHSKLSDNTHYLGLHSILPPRSPNQPTSCETGPPGKHACGALPLVRVAAFAEPHRGLLALRALPARLADK